ncbi:hypothetical protein COT78_00435 [Candidatus Berkelbacteria bacterium CG10_big_fil_rev_8_21_14_0_10_43_13]|uniref:Peptidase C39-like domain-containing protein n=1 Tax=Candidatus Berkelbacteria bacterium CG10_big_fil_rev_8_21_14_0_10_43_13 TaxID=1974514 RepID=A0A2H0W7K1_9BACT|nr:MAG: hypothetical protein COT78_00435 [Candidatus Berkelbacteria bacterium CG10_big_fil_rev_8_21_14_0_10_43_13]
MRKNKFRLLPRMITGILFFSFLVYYALLVNKTTPTNQALDTNDNEIVSVPEVLQSEQTDNSSALSEPVPVQPDPVELPSKINLDVPFMSQAPLAVWDDLHEDACEEASFLMVKHFIDKTAISSPSSFDAEINSMIDYEESSGYGPSITLQDLAVIAKTKYNLLGEIRTATISNLKTELAAGRPIIVGAAGKILPNPNFRNGGPNYHMLVIKGYNSTEFITDDPGTRKGHNFVYTYDDLINAIHNWNPENILNGTREYLVFP